MEITIEIKEFKSSGVASESYKTFFGWKSREVKVPQVTSYDVILTIVPTEEERAIILQFKLNELLIEDEPSFTREQIAAFQQGQDEVVAGAPYPDDARENAKQIMKEVRSRRNQTKMERYFDNPYVRNFSTPTEAHKYADKLEKEFLPIIKSNIDYCRLQGMGGDKRTFTL